MTTNLIIRDESMSGETLREFNVEIPAEKITVREMIRNRVYQEVKESNAQAVSKTADSVELIRRSEYEIALNGKQPRQPKLPDWQSRFEKALDAFSTNRIMILVDDRQVNSLNQEFEITTTTKISFLRLTMLMGG